MGRPNKCTTIEDFRKPEITRDCLANLVRNLLKKHNPNALEEFNRRMQGGSYMSVDKPKAPKCPHCGDDRFVEWTRREYRQRVDFDEEENIYRWGDYYAVPDDGDFIEFRCVGCDQALPESFLSGWID